MSPRGFASALILLAALLAGCDSIKALVGSDSGAAPDGPWLVQLGPDHITPRMLQVEIALTVADLEIDPNGADMQTLKARLLEDLIDRTLLVQEARRRKIVVSPDALNLQLAQIYGDAEPETVAKAAAAAKISEKELRRHIRLSLLVKKLFREDIYPRLLIKDDELKAAYEANPDEFTTPEMVRVQQIFTHTEEDAQLAYRRLRQGESFADVARDVSEGPEKEQGGDMGWIKRGAMPEPYDELVFKLPRRVYNRPVKSAFGFHIFHIADHRAANELGFEEAKPALRRHLLEAKKREAEAELIARLKKRTEIVRMDETKGQS